MEMMGRLRVMLMLKILFQKITYILHILTTCIIHVRTHKLVIALVCIYGSAFYSVVNNYENAKLFNVMTTIVS